MAKIEPITKKDDRGNKIYSKNANGYEQFWEFDEKNHLTRWSDSNGLECIWEYDELSRPIFMKGPDGTEIHQKYKHNCIYQYYSNGIIKTIDTNNRLVYEKDINGKEHYFD